MKKTVRVLSGVVAVLTLISSAIIAGSADRVEKYRNYKGWIYSDFNVSEEDYEKGYVDITGYKGKKKKATVPTEIKGRKVVSIFGYGNIKYLHIPKEMKATHIANAKNLKKVTVEKGHELYTVKNNLLLSKDKTILYGCPRGNTNPKIPKTVKTIGENAFEGAKLKTFKVPENVTTIGSSAFYQCKNLTEITFNKKLKKIDYSAFSGCKSLKSVVLPNSVKEIGDFVFYGCSSLTEVYLGNKLTALNCGIFGECDSLEEVQIPSSVKKMYDDALANSSLKRAYIYNKKCKISYNESDWVDIVWTAIPSDITIYGYKGSTAEKYAKKNGNEFVALRSK